ncbi:MAG: hypothetical protein R6U89_09785 [Dehalococcoidia bacterium]
MYLRVLIGVMLFMLIALVVNTCINENGVPASPGGLSAVREGYDPESGMYGDRILLTRGASAEADVKAYRVYRCFERQGGIENFPKTAYTLLATVDSNSYIDKNMK